MLGIQNNAKLASHRPDSLSKLSVPTSPAREARSAPLAAANALPFTAPFQRAMSAQPYSDFDRQVFEIREKRLVAKITEFMDNPKQNPQKGSMPSERVQNCIKQKYPELYASVVGSEYANQWHKFLQNHKDSFELLFPSNDGRNLPRIRLTCHEDFEEADKGEAEERRARERTIVRCLQHCLEKHEDDIKVEDFMKEYETLDVHAIDPELGFNPKPPLPRFRDVVRLVKRHPHLFSFDPEPQYGPRIRSADTWSAPPSAATKPQRKRDPRSPTSAPFGRFPSAPVVPTRVASWGPYTTTGLTSPVSLPTAVSWQGEAVVADSDPDLFPTREANLKEHIKQFLDNPQHNAHHGSLPSERVQNCIKASHPDLYKSVVGAGYANQWHRFIQCHGDLFNLFFVEDNKRSVWRIRLNSHKDWEAADRRERHERQAKENAFLTTLREYLEQRPERSCTVDEFTDAYAKTPQHEISPLPPRGDFVRFVRRHSEYFAYDKEKYVISLLDQSGVPTADPNALVESLSL